MTYRLTGEFLTSELNPDKLREVHQNEWGEDSCFLSDFFFSQCLSSLPDLNLRVVSLLFFLLNKVSFLVELVVCLKEVSSGFATCRCEQDGQQKSCNCVCSWIVETRRF
jgi:hypothetical protein